MRLSQDQKDYLLAYSLYRQTKITPESFSPYIRLGAPKTMVFLDKVMSDKRRMQTVEVISTLYTIGRLMTKMGCKQ